MSTSRQHGAHRQPMFIALVCVEPGGYPDWDESLGAYVNVAWAAQSLEMAEEVLRSRFSASGFRVSEIEDLRRYDPSEFYGHDSEFVRLADKACRTGFEWGTFNSFPLDSEE